jgi:hypothetical protein
MFSFNAGGTVVGYDNVSRVSPSIGAWRKTQNLTYRVRTKNAIYAADGSLKFFITAAGTLKLSADSRSFTFTGRLLAPDGTLLETFSSPMTATRF